MKTYQVTAVEDIATHRNMTSVITMRYRLESDPDVDLSYTTVTDTKDFLGMTVYDFDPTVLDPGIYIIHHYYTADGPLTGSKFTLEITEPIPV